MNERHGPVQLFINPYQSSCSGFINHQSSFVIIIMVGTYPDPKGLK